LSRQSLEDLKPRKPHQYVYLKLALVIRTLISLDLGEILKD